MDAKHILDRVSYHAVYDLSILDALEYARRNGFAGIQLAVEAPHLSFESLPDRQIQRIASFVETKGTYITIHAPDRTTSLFQPSEYLRRGIRDYYRALFEFASRVKAPLVTIHMGSPVTFRTDTKPETVIPEEDLALYRKAMQENMTAVIEMSGNRFLICVENDEINEFNLSVLEPYLNGGGFALCWDVAKSWNSPETEQFMLSHLRHVKQVHLHDIRRGKNGLVRSHCVIGSGIINFSRYLNWLAAADVLDYCIEVRPRERAVESLGALKRLLSVA